MIAPSAAKAIPIFFIPVLLKCGHSTIQRGERSFGNYRRILNACSDADAPRVGLELLDKAGCPVRIISGRQSVLACPLKDRWLCVGRCTPCLRNAWVRRIIAR